MLLHAVLLALQAAGNADLGYVMSLPDGFGAIPAEFAGGRAGDAVGCWAGEGSQSNQGAIVLCVQRMHATLGREHLKPSDLPARSQLVTVRWNGLDIDAIRTDTAQTGAAITVYTAQVPLRKEAIQVVAAGQAREPRRRWQSSTRCSVRSRVKPTGFRPRSGPAVWGRLSGGSLGLRSASSSCG